MSKKPVDMGSYSALSESVISLRETHKKKAKHLLDAYCRGDESAIGQFMQRIPEAKSPDFEPTLLHARLLVSSDGLRVKKPSLEKLKKDAKDLLKALKSGDSVAFERLANHHNKTPHEIKLADAQLIIARENSYTSWAKAKAHIAQLNDAGRQMVRPRALDSDLKTLHIRCGNDIKEALEKGGFTGDFLEICNPFPVGPVPHFLPRDNFIQVRENYLQKTFSEYIPQERKDSSESTLINEEEVLSTIEGRYDRVVLWFEHDSYDQLCKAYVLAHLVQQTLNKVTVECIQIDDFPGMQKFIGIGQVVGQRPETIYLLWQQRQRVTDEMMSYGNRCWQAFTQPDPTQLWHLVQAPNVVCETMRNAYVRSLMELPWVTNGLSLTEYLSVEILSNEGPMRPGAIFSLLMSESEPLPYLGDIMLATILQNLCSGEHPAIDVMEHYPREHPMRKTKLKITETGKRLLEGKANWLRLNKDNTQFERYVGGVRVSPAHQNWCWNPALGRPELA